MDSESEGEIIEQAAPDAAIKSTQSENASPLSSSSFSSLSDGEEEGEISLKKDLDEESSDLSEQEDETKEISDNSTDKVSRTNKKEPSADIKKEYGEQAVNTKNDKSSSETNSADIKQTNKNTKQTATGSPFTGENPSMTEQGEEKQGEGDSEEVGGSPIAPQESNGFDMDVDTPNDQIDDGDNDTAEKLQTIDAEAAEVPMEETAEEAVIVPAEDAADERAEAEAEPEAEAEAEEQADLSMDESSDSEEKKQKVNAIADLKVIEQNFALLRDLLYHERTLLMDAEIENIRSGKQSRTMALQFEVFREQRDVKKRVGYRQYIARKESAYNTFKANLISAISQKHKLRQNTKEGMLRQARIKKASVMRDKKALLMSNIQKMKIKNILNNEEEESNNNNNNNTNNNNHTTIESESRRKSEEDVEYRVFGLITQMGYVPSAPSLEGLSAAEIEADTKFLRNT